MPEQPETDRLVMYSYADLSGDRFPAVYDSLGGGDTWPMALYKADLIYPKTSKLMVASSLAGNIGGTPADYFDFMRCRTRFGRFKRAWGHSGETAPGFIMDEQHLGIPCLWLLGGRRHEVGGGATGQNQQTILPIHDFRWLRGYGPDMAGKPLT